MSFRIMYRAWQATSGTEASAAPDPLLTGLVAWYRNNGADWSGHGNVMTSPGAPTTTMGFDGLPNTAMLLLAGGDDYYTRPSLLTAQAGPHSIGGWFNVLGSDDITNLAVEFTAAFVVNLGLQSASLESQNWFVDPGSNVFGSADIPAWSHWVGTYNGTTAVLWINGVAVASAPFAAVWNAPSSTFSVGRNSAAMLAAQWVGVWSRALSPTDVGRLYAAGLGFDPTA